MTTILTDDDVIEVQASAGLWLSATDAARATGWTLKPEGMCRDDLCVPLPASSIRGESVDVAAFWRQLGAPVVHEPSEDVWVLGASAETRNAARGGTAAPDFTLPGLDGKPHTLSSLRGRKVFLVTWASW